MNHSLIKYAVFMTKSFINNTVDKNHVEKLGDSAVAR